MENKKRKLEYWRNFESSREAKNQQKKFDRIDARKEKRKDYPQLKDETHHQNVSVRFFFEYKSTFLCFHLPTNF